METVYLTENEGDAPLHSALQEYIDEGFVVYSVDADDEAQMRVYLKCLQDHGNKHNWMAFIDMDEFLVMRGEYALPPSLPVRAQVLACVRAWEPSGYTSARVVAYTLAQLEILGLRRVWRACRQTLKQMLDEFKYFPGLVVNWVIFGPGGRETRPEHGGVLRHYTRCRQQPWATFKTIANTFFTEDVSWHPHNLIYQCPPSSCPPRWLCFHPADLASMSATLLTFPTSLLPERSCWGAAQEQRHRGERESVPDWPPLREATARVQGAERSHRGLPTAASSKLVYEACVHRAHRAFPLQHKIQRRFSPEARAWGRQHRCPQGRRVFRALGQVR